MQSEKLIERLNSGFGFIRRIIIKDLKNREAVEPQLVPDRKLKEINLNIHTDFSFSPYTPSLAAYMAYKSGVKVACSCDYGTEFANEEFIYSCNVLGISALNGFEVTLSDKEGKECLASFYSITPECKQEFKPLLTSFREQCVQRAKIVCEKINRKLRKYDMSLDFDKDVYKFVKGKKGATLTLKHVYMATAVKLEQKFGKGRRLAEFLRTTLCLDILEGEYNLLCDANDPFYRYDLISALRHNFNSVEAGLTPPALADYIAIAKRHGCAAAYEYSAPNNWLKNQTESEQTLLDFEAEIERAKKMGFNVICISAQNLSASMIVDFIKAIEKREMLAVFAEKTEYPRNHFGCAAPASCRAYIEKCAYSLLGSEISMNINRDDGFFSNKSIKKCPDFQRRITLFAQIGKSKGRYED